ncbi:hypothetical protein Hdeb2414_s0387g00883121 [Helianthus debilis subsp. tardiflorus]
MGGGNIIHIGSEENKVTKLVCKSLTFEWKPRAWRSRCNAMPPVKKLQEMQVKHLRFLLTSGISAEKKLNCIVLQVDLAKRVGRVGLGGGSKRVRVRTGHLKKRLFWFGSERVRVGTGSGRNGFGSERVWVGTGLGQNEFRVGSGWLVKNFNHV